jgi:DNA polymerase-3 subunit beta
MKITCNRGALLEALSVTGNVVAARTPKPVLQCLKLTAGDDRLVVSATDLEVAIRFADTQVQIERPGEALLPAEKLRDIVRESVDDTLVIEVNGDTANVKGQDSHFKIFTQPVADFPPVPDFQGQADFQLSAGLLKQLINQTLFATLRESTRYAFNGVLFSTQGKKLQLVATDGRRLALARGDLTSTASPETKSKETKSADAKSADSKTAATAIVPAKALALVDKLIDDPEESMGVQLRENQAIFHTSSATLTTNLVEGQFPPYEDVIPKDVDKQMTAATADFHSAIRRAALLTTAESKGVRLQFSKKGLILTSRSPEAGEATINFPCKYEGADVEIGFNPQFLTDALRVVGSDDVTLELQAPNRPGLLKGGPNFLYVIMPVNLT